MVSMRCFCGVGEFCKIKSIPCGSFTSNTGALAVPVTESSTRTRIAADNPLSILVPDTAKRTFSAQPLRPKNSEQELQRKLNQTRICPRRGTGDHAEVRIVCRTTSGIRRSKLRPVQQVEELHAKFHAGTSLSIEREAFESGDIEIVDPIRAQG